MSQALAEKVAEKFGDRIYGVSEHAFARQWRVDVRHDAALDVLRFCRDELSLSYLADVTAIDNLQQPAPRPERFEVIYVLHGLPRRETLVIRAYVPDGDPTVDSATALWPQAANWLEREVYDMFGIGFRNHPNLIRILTPENFEGHALRKDFPTEGIGYRDRFPIVSREEA